MPDSKEDSSPQTPSLTKVVVTLDDDALSDMEAATVRLKEAGLAVEDVLDFIGQVVGELPREHMDSLREIEGVADVSESRTIQLPPPGSVIQ